MSDKVKQEVLNEDYILNTIDKKSSKIDKLLSPHSFMHICWYSELRELLSRNPGLSDKLEIFPLPGKGFKGDWHIGILNGSVSANLGLRVIEKLCNKNEDFKRFTLGIGLPTRKKFYEKDEGGFLAWPNSKIETEKKYRSNLIGEKDNKKYSNLALIYKIHEQAHERAKINGYIYFKEMLAALFKELILIEYSINNNSYENEKINEDERNKRIQEIIIDRLNPLYEVLC